MKGKFMEYEWDLMEYGILAIKHGWTIPPNGHVETSSIFNIPLHPYSVPVIPPFFLVQSEIPSNFGMTWGFSSEMEKPYRPLPIRRAPSTTATLSPSSAIALSCLRRLLIAPVMIQVA